MKPFLKLNAAIVPLVLLVVGCAGAGSGQAGGRPSLMEIAHTGKALWEEKCRTVAGEKIYRTVPEVEGVLLMRIRSERSERNAADPMWPGAVFARESYADEYIQTFLGYERAFSSLNNGLRPITKEYRGYVSTTRVPGQTDRPGYRWVDVIDPKDGVRYRYSGSVKIVGRMDVTAKGVQMLLARDPNHDLNIYRWTLDKTPAPDPAPRYAVTYEDHVIPEERALGVASSTVKVIDLQTQEVLGEMVGYVWGIFPANSANPTPWLSAHSCIGHASSSNTTTRMFVDQILIPKPEK